MKPVIQSAAHYAAIVTLDPAAKADCGIAVRCTASLVEPPKRGKLRFPEFTFEGWVFSPRMHDDLANYLAQHIGRQRVLFATENAAFRGTARHLGRAIGCIEGLLHDLGVSHPDETLYLFPKHWRNGSMPAVNVKGRDEWKRAAIDTCATLYGEDLGDNLAEAVLMNDHIITNKRAVWTKAPAKKSRKAA